MTAHKEQAAALLQAGKRDLLTLQLMKCVSAWNQEKTTDQVGCRIASNQKSCQKWLDSK
jgi:hypothetical protein